MISKTLARLGFSLKSNGEAPIINDGRGNRPTVTVRYAGGYGVGSSWRQDFASMAQAGYGENSDVYACISLIAQAGKQVKWDQSPGSRSGESIKLLQAAGGPT